MKRYLLIIWLITFSAHSFEQKNDPMGLAFYGIIGFLLFPRPRLELPEGHNANVGECGFDGDSCFKVSVNSLFLDSKSQRGSASLVYFEDIFEWPSDEYREKLKDFSNHFGVLRIQF